jgi:molybdenum cofactor cytidylyltransferase
MSPLVIVLASGRGERFLASGGTTHKLQALIGAQTVLQHTLSAVRASGLAWHVEDAGHPGMGDSIAAAVRANPTAGSWLILPADLPLIQPDTLLAVARALAAPVVVPTYLGQRGHPVRFEACCAEQLMALRGEQGAARIVKAFGATLLPVDDEGCVTDIDTVQDLALARTLWKRRHGS